MISTRTAATVASLVVLTAGLATRTYLDGPVAKYLGVALWATLVVQLVVWCRPTVTLWRAGLVALAISWAVEFAQLTPGPAWLSSQHVVLRMIFGTSFHFWDLPSYAGGVLLGMALYRTWLELTDRSGGRKHRSR